MDTVIIFMAGTKPDIKWMERHPGNRYPEAGLILALANTIDAAISVSPSRAAFSTP